MAQNYKILLGVELDTSDIQKQINAASDNIKPIELKIDAETKELTNTIRDALNSLSKGTKNALTLDTSSIEISLDRLCDTIRDIKTSLGTLDSKSGMKNLLSSINQIANALGKVENESDNLVKSLNALSKKDFSINFGLNMGKSASQVASEQGDLRRDAISQLKQQVKALEDYFDQYYKVAQQGAGVAKLTQGTNVFKDYWELAPNIGDTNTSLKQQVATYKQYIDLMQQAAKIRGIDLSGVTSGFSKTTDDIVKETRSATNNVEQLSQAFKGLFGSGIDGEKLSTQLDSIAVDLNEIKNSFKSLSEGISIDEITTSLREMPVVLSDITDNLAVFRNVFGNVGRELSAPVSNATQGLKNNANVLDTFKRSLQNIGMGADEIDSVANRIKNLGVQIETLNQSKAKNGDKEILTVDISGIDRMGNAIKLTEQYDIATGNLIKSIDRVSTVQQKAGASTNNFVKQQKQAVTNLTNQINRLNREANDQNAPRAIKDSTHLDALKTKYNDIISAIQRMENASSDTFVDEQNNVKKLISEYQSLVKEIRNAENVATSLRSKDIDTVKGTYSSKLDVLISKMKSSGVYTSGFESGAENLRSVLSSATDASGLVKFLNGLDKLEAGYKRADAAVKEFNRSQKVGINVSGLESKIVDIQRISPEIDQFEAEIDGAKVSVKSLLSDLGKVKTQGDFSVVNARFKAFADAAKAVGIAITETVTKVSSVNKIKIKIDDTGFNGFEQEVRRAHLEAEKLEGSTAELETALRRLDTAMAGVYSADQAGDIRRLVAANEEYETALKGVYSQLKLNQQAEKQTYDAEILSQKKASLGSEMEIWLKENSRAAKDFGEEIRRLQASLDGLDANGVKLVGQQFKNITKQAQVVGKTGLTVFDKLKSKFKEYAAYLSAAEIFMYAEQALRSMFEQVKLIDSAMTELKKVTNETDEAYSNFLKNAATRSREIGTTIDGLVSSTADFARLGYGFEDAQGLAEVANIYAVVGDEIEGVEGATESLISTMAAFKNEMNGMSNTEFAMSIIDKFNEIGNNFAISSGGIGEALERSASSLMAANNTIDESIALITAANTVVQDPEQVGTAFKTISMRIRGAKTELEEAGLETDGMVESTAKLRSEILALTGIDIMDGANEFKSTYAIMDELAQKWQDLTDIQQATVTELIAGKRQGNIVSSLMTNFDTAREALETSMNSAGSAMKEHEKWQQSLEAQINKLKASWQGLSQAFLSSDFLKSVLNGVINLVDGLTKLIDTFGAFPTLMGTVAAGFSLFKNGGLFKTFNNNLDGFINKIGIANKSFAELMNAFSSANTGGIKGFFNGLKSMGDALINPLSKSDIANIQAYNQEIKNGTSAQTAWYRTMQTSSKSAQDLVAAAKGGEVALNGMKTASIGAKVGLIGAKVAAVAFNAALTMGISLLIDWAVSGVMKLVNADKELAESVEELTSKYKQQHEELQKLKGDYDTSNESSMISKYAKLSKGVNALGKNVSLTADEYSEYQSIVNQIADQIPTLISGYDEQGNAILSVKGNVETLTKAYENLIHTQNQEILSKNANDIEKNWKNVISQVNEYDDAEKIGNLLSWDGILGGKTDDYDMKTDTAEWLGSLTAETSLKDIKKELGDDLMRKVEIKQALQNAGFDINQWSTKTQVAKVLKKALENEPEKIKGILDNYYAQFDDAVAEYKTIATALLSEAFDVSSSISGLNYGNISEELQTIAYQIVNSLDFDFLNNLSNEGISIQDWVKNMLDQLSAFDSEHATKIETAFDLQTQFNGGEISYGEYVDGLVSTGKTIDELVSSGKLDKEIGTQLKLSIGLDEKGLVDEYQRLRNRLASSEYFNISEPEYESFIESLSSEELSVVWDVIPELEETSLKENIEQVKAALKKEMMIQGLTFDLNLEVETAGIEALNVALAESVSGSGLSSDSINALKGRYAELEKQGWDLSTMFEETSHGIHLNRQEFNKFEKAYASQKLKDVNADLDEMKATYDELGEQLKTCGDEAKAGIYNDRFTLAQKISEAATLAAQYEGLTSAYNDWLAAEEAGQERDMYENVISGFETVDDEISRGWYDDSTIEFLELLTGKDLSTAGIDEIKKAYKGLDEEIKHTSYSIRDFFTVDDEGNTTADGVYNFLDAVGQMEEEKFGGKDIVKRNKNGKIISFDFELAGGDEAIAEALGISEELVQIMKRAADDAGFVVTLDGSYKQLADLQKEAKSAAEYLKSIGKTDFNFDFNTTSVENLNKQLGEAHKILDDPDFWNKDGTFNFDADGATEAMQIVSTLQAKIDSLTQEQYGIGLTVEDEEFEEPLEKLQNYGRTVATLNQLKLNPEANTEDIEKFEGELEDIAKYFAELDKDKKVKLGFDADDNWEEVQKKIESGEVKIPTVLDIQANMDKNIETLADLALLDSGLLSDSEEATIRKKYNIDVEADEVDTSDVDDKVDDAVNGSGGKEATRKQNVQIIADVLGVEDVDDLSSKLKGLDDKTIQAIAEVLGRTDVEKLQQTMALIEPKKVQAIAEAIGKGDVDGLRSAIKNLDPKTVQAIAEALGYSDVNELDNAIAGMDGNTVQAVAQALGLGDVNTLQITVNNMQGNTVDAKVNTDGQSQKINTLQGQIDGMRGNTVTITTVMKTVYEGAKKAVKNGAAAGKKMLQKRNMSFDSDVNGTAHLNGTVGRAYKQGSWGTKNSGTALVGELGAETLVRQGKYYVIGSEGAEFIKYRKGDIIFNHKQTEELFKNGKVTADGGRARAFVQGTAFDTGTGGGEYGGSAVGSNDKDKTEETFDWIETLISRLERTIDNLDQTVNNAYKSWSDRNTALTNEISEVGNLIAKQESAYGAYMAKANKVGLDESWASKVRNGTIDINTITDENLAEKIKDYETWYEKALAAKDAIEELKETESELYEQRFENVQSQYDGILQGFEHTESMLNEYISQAEAKGHLVSKNYYQALIDNEKNNIDELKKEQSDLIAKRDEAVASGTIIRGSQAWYDMCAEIDGVTQAIEEGTTALIEYDNAMRDIDWEVFDLIQERISDVIDEADFLIELMSNDKLHNDDGSLTDKGMATMGQHAVKYNSYMYAADEYGAEVAKLDTQIAEDPYDQELINRRNELLELQRESILAAEDEKNAIRDLIEEGIELELDALQELIDKKNEELESEKDLYEYSKKVKEQTEEIASLEKQMAAYSGDNSEEARARIQELKVSLEEAKTNLEETEYDKYLSDTQQMLDTLYDEYELTLNARLDNLDYLVQGVIDAVNIAAGADGTLTTALSAEGAIATALGTNATTIKTTLENEAKNVGTTLSAAMSNIWNAEGSGNKVVTMYGEGFQQQQTTTNTVLNSIKASIDRMVDDIDKDATTKVNSNKTTTSAKKNPTTTSTTKKTTTTKKTSSSGDGKPKIGDKVKFLSGKYYYDSQGVTPAGSKNHGKQVYITNINTRSWATHPYHISTGTKLGKGDLGWLKLNQISGYATGKKNFLNDEIAWTQENGKEFIVRPSDGAILTPIAKGDSVLNAQASGNIWNMANNPTEFIKDSLKLDATNVPNGSSVNNSCVQNFENITFNMPNVRNYEQLLSEMQKDPKFDKLIKAMTIDQIAGKSSLAKNKSIR